MSLVGQLIVLTRAAEHESDLAPLLEQAGAHVVQVPTVAVVPLQERELAPFDAAARALANYDAVLLTSANAARLFLSRISALGVALRSVQNLTVFAIGPATARVFEQAYVNVHVAQQAVSEGVLGLVLETWGRDLAHKRFLFPRGKEGRDVLWQGLANHGAHVDVVTLYETKPLLEGAALPAQYDWLVFASPSAVRAFVARFGTQVHGRVACMGPITQAMAAQLGMRVDVVASPHTAQGLVAGLVSAE